MIKIWQKILKTFLKTMTKTKTKAFNPAFRGDFLPFWQFLVSAHCLVIVLLILSVFISKIYFLCLSYMLNFCSLVQQQSHPSPLFEGDLLISWHGVFSPIVCYKAGNPYSMSSVIQYSCIWRIWLVIRGIEGVGHPPALMMCALLGIEHLRHWPVGSSSQVNNPTFCH